MRTKNDYIRLVEGKDLEYKNLYLLFGYKEDITKDEESKIKIGGKIYSEVNTIIYLKRDSNIKNYDKLKALQEEYFLLCNKKKEKPKKINGFLLFILLLLGIIPGLIYLIIKGHKKNNIVNNEARLYEIIEEAKKLSGYEGDKNDKSN